MTLTKRRDELDWPTWFGRRLFDWPETWKGFLDETSLRVEEYQEGDNLVVRAEMPGIDPEKDVDITMSDHTLHMHAERHFETKTEDAKGFHTEFHYGEFSRDIMLPAGATMDDIKATYTDGILEVRIPMGAAAEAAKRVPIMRG